jgi:hypothetical protein
MEPIPEEAGAVGTPLAQKGWPRALALEALKSARPWAEVAGAPSAWSLPVDRGDALQRAGHNGRRFCTNYAMCVAGGTVFGLALHPAAAAALLCLLGLGVAAQAALGMSGGRLSASPAERAALALLASVLGLFFFSDAAAVLLTSAALSAAACGVHAACREPVVDLQV